MGLVQGRYIVFSPPENKHLLKRSASFLAYAIKLDNS